MAVAAALCGASGTTLDVHANCILHMRIVTMALLRAAMACDSGSLIGLRRGLGRLALWA
jgi:hypothetical protein